MDDNERSRIEAICKVANVNDIEDVSDGFHTFRQLYYQRMILFATIVKQNRDKAWKSLRHEDGELCFGGEWFIVGVDTPKGTYTYHYEANYYSMFDCKELERGKHWDGHTEADAETRLLSLEPERKKGEWEIYDYEYDGEDEHAIIRCGECKYFPPKDMDTYNYCPNCGARMKYCTDAERQKE